MGIFAVRSSRESNRLVASTEFDIEPGDECVDEVRPSGIQGEWGLKGQVFGFYRVEIDGKNLAGIGDTGFELHSIDKRFSQGGVLQGCKIESIDIIPD